MILSLLPLALGAGLHASVPAGSIDDFVDEEVRASGVPGVAYAVIEDGEVTLAGARGTQEMGGGGPVTPDTPFLTGSITKSFTALAVMQLAEAGEVDVDAELSRYLPAFADRPAGAITLRQLLSHTSGYSTLQGNQSHGEASEDALAREVDRLAREGPASAPGSRWEYSNANYQVLGRLIEVVSGEDYAHYLEAHILRPLGMTQSFVASGVIDRSMATGHRPWFGTWRARRVDAIRVTAPQGGIVASANDLARYLAVMMNGRDDVLSAEGKALMMRPASAESPEYGFGWSIDTKEGSVWHGGTSPGFDTLAAMLPAERKGAVVLVNAGSGMAFGDTAGLRMGIVSRALGLDYAGEPDHVGLKVMFVALALLPIGFLLAIAWAWRRRPAIRAKTRAGAFGRFSLWFPLLTTLAAAVFIFTALPCVAGLSLATLRLYQPDFGLVLIAVATSGVAWALFRLGVAYSGGVRRPSERTAASRSGS
ncbi:MAG: serine hydrolase [Nannocystaceae bacterium]